MVRKSMKKAGDNNEYRKRYIFIEKNYGTKNGTHRRTLNTRYGFIEDIRG